MLWEINKSELTNAGEGILLAYLYYLGMLYNFYELYIMFKYTRQDTQLYSIATKVEVLFKYLNVCLCVHLTRSRAQIYMIFLIQNILCNEFLFSYLLKVF